MVLEEMMERSKGNGENVVAQVSIRSLASSLGFAKDTVARAVRRLSDLGVIEAVQARASSGVFEPGSYRLAVPARFASVACPSCARRSLLPLPRVLARLPAALPASSPSFLRSEARSCVRLSLRSFFNFQTGARA